MRPNQVVELAYYAVYFGIGKTSTPMLKAALGDRVDDELISVVVALLSGRQGVARNKVRLGQRSHVPFDGHQSRLGHYYRHLFQLVSYVDQQDLGIDKYEYVRTIRAQLSTHEQVLLFVNSVTRLGQNWWKRGFMKRYRLVKNVPQDFLDPVLCKLENHFDASYFEWQGVRDSEWRSPLEVTKDSGERSDG